MNYKKWIFPEIDKEAVSVVAEECGLDPLVVLIAFSKGFYEPYEIEQFLSKEPEFSDPFDLSGMSEAVERINIALESNEKILIFGDYDCDGVTATAVLMKYLLSRGADVDFVIPDREKDGYGISVDAVRRAADSGVSLIITVDNGINAVEEIAEASKLGIDVVVTDHHLSLGELPEAYAVVDPHLDEECDWIFHELCGAGVAFKLVCALEGRPCEEMLYEYADLVAIGTIADIVPLKEENRVIVSVGIEMLNRRQNVGVKALMEAANVKFLTSGNAAFSLCPRINAAGRMASADMAVKLLLSESMDDAVYYAGCLDRLNLERQRIEQDIFKEACNIIEQKGYNHNRVIVVDGFNWHVGVIGIAASKLTEKYGKPCIVISKMGDKAVGSGRSVGEFSLFNALQYSADCMEKFGGHEMAAGLTVLEEKIPILRNSLNNYAKGQPMCFAEIRPDCKIKPRAFTVDAVKALRALEPYGAGNSVPLFGVMSSEISGIYPLAGGKHLRLRFKKEGFDFQALLFNQTPESFIYRVGDSVDLAVNIDINVYNNVESVSVIIKSMRYAGLDEAAVFSGIEQLEDLKSRVLSKDKIDEVIPTREDIATVFRYIQSRRSVRREHIEVDLFGRLSFAKIDIALTALIELGIVTLVDGFYMLAAFSGKADLESAPTLKTLKAMKEGEVVGG